jgi:hypothetical protein
MDPNMANYRMGQEIFEGKEQHEAAPSNLEGGSKEKGFMTGMGEYAIDPRLLHPQMEVVTADSVKVGHIAGIRQNAFGLARDHEDTMLEVSFHDIRTINNDQVMLRHTYDQWKNNLHR